MNDLQLFYTFRSIQNCVINRLKNRIAAKGYGELRIKNRCVDGVRCSKTEHQENRRTEIRITDFKEKNAHKNYKRAGCPISQKVVYTSISSA